MSQEKLQFKLKFNTPSGSDEELHQISADVLGEHLTDLASLVRNSVKTINGEDATADLNVTAHKEGSFIVEFSVFLSQGGIDVLRNLGITSSAAAAASGTVLSLLKVIGTRKVVKTVAGDNDKTQIHLDDGEKIDCSDDVAALIDNYAVRKGVENTVSKPFYRSKATCITFLSEDDKVVETISKEESRSFTAPPRKQFTSEASEVKRVEISFTIISFEKSTGWEIKHKSDLIKVKINDTAFLERVRTSKRDFKKSQLFTVDLMKKSKLVDGNTTVTHSIEQVIS